MDEKLRTVILTIEAAAEIAGVHPTSLVKYERQGHLPARRQLGGSKVFLRSDFEKWLADRDAGRLGVRVTAGKHRKAEQSAVH